VLIRSLASLAHASRVQFVRFFWKTGAGSDGAGRKAKILRQVRHGRAHPRRVLLGARCCQWRDQPRGSDRSVLDMVRDIRGSLWLERAVDG
jgi:hypothetical protein